MTNNWSLKKNYEQLKIGFHYRKCSISLSWGINTSSGHMNIIKVAVLMMKRRGKQQRWGMKFLPPEQACHRQNFSLSWLAENASSAERTQCPCSLLRAGRELLPRLTSCFMSAPALWLRSQHWHQLQRHQTGTRFCHQTPGLEPHQQNRAELTELCLKPSHGSSTKWIPSLLGRWPAWRGWCRERFWCVKFTDYRNRTLWGEKKAD